MTHEGDEEDGRTRGVGQPVIVVSLPFVLSWDETTPSLTTEGHCRLMCRVVLVLPSLFCSFFTFR